MVGNVRTHPVSSQGVKTKYRLTFNTAQRNWNLQGLKVHGRIECVRRSRKSALRRKKR